MDIIKVKKWIDEAEVIIIGAGAGLSDAAGIHYGGVKFEKDFEDFIKNILTFYYTIFMLTMQVFTILKLY